MIIFAPKHMAGGRKSYYYFFLGLLVAGVPSCREGSRQDKPAETAKVTAKPPASFGDTLTISTPAAVFFAPDSAQLQRIKEITDPRIFDGSMHEYEYLVKNARNALLTSRPRLPVLDPRNVRFLQISGPGLPDTCLDLDAIKEPYGLLFVPRGHAPVLVDMANIPTELERYFPASDY